MALKAKDVLKKTGKTGGKGKDKPGKSDSLIAWIGNRRPGKKKAAAGKERSDEE